MNKEKVIKLFTDGKIETSDKRQFTRLLGGFGNNKPMFTIWQAGDLLNISSREITQNYTRNASNFEINIDVKDLKSVITENDSQKIIDITKFLKNIGYSQNKLNATKQWLIFSYSGMMKLVKIVTTKESWDIYDRFLEDYFKTKAENEVMKDSIKNEIKALIKDKAFYLGESLISSDETERIKYAQKSEDITKRIIELEKTKSEKEVLAKVKNKLDVADKIGKSKNDFDVGKVAKILGIKHMGRNNMFKWLRDEEILQADNTPYQRYMDYFSVQAIPAANGYTYYKTLLKPTGIGYN